MGRWPRWCWTTRPDATPWVGPCTPPSPTWWPRWMAARTSGYCSYAARAARRSAPARILPNFGITGWVTPTSGTTRSSTGPPTRWPPAGSPSWHAFGGRAWVAASVWLWQPTSVTQPTTPCSPCRPASWASDTRWTQSNACWRRWADRQLPNSCLPPAVWMPTRPDGSA